MESNITNVMLGILMTVILVIIATLAGAYVNLMTKRSCPHCRAMMSKKAILCPHCGKGTPVPI